MAGPRELYDAIVAETRCETAILDGVLVSDWKDESDLEVDDHAGRGEIFFVEVLKIAAGHARLDFIGAVCGAG